MSELQVIESSNPQEVEDAIQAWTKDMSAENAKIVNDVLKKHSLSKGVILYSKHTTDIRQRIQLAQQIAGNTH